MKQPNVLHWLQMFIWLSLTAFTLPETAAESPIPTHQKIYAPQDQTVMFNTKTLIYHDPNCRWAKACTVNCISVDRSEAIHRGARPCKVCGGKKNP